MKRTSWPHVFIAFFAGCSTSFHFGKVPAALPRLLAEFDSALIWGGLVVSSLSLTLAAIGMLAGGLAERIGYLRAALIALALCGGASLLGALAPALPWLLASRFLEGIGFTLAIVTLPSLIGVSVTEHDRPLALGLWGGFMPTGFASMLVLSPWLIDAVGWRGLWALTGALTLSFGLLTRRAFRGVVAAVPKVPLRDTLRLATRRRPLLMAGCFVLFPAQFLAVMSFLPAMLMDNYALSAGIAGFYGGLVVFTNAGGNAIAGGLMRAGLGVRALVAGSMAVMALTALVIFAEALPMAARIAAAFVFAVVSGLIPGSLFASAHEFVDHPRQLGGIMGLAMQGVGIGQLTGPVILAFVVDRYGWSNAPYFTVSAAMLGMFLALGLGGRRPATGRPA